MDPFHLYCTTENIIMKTAKSSGELGGRTLIQTDTEIWEHFFFLMKDNISVRNIFIGGVLFLLLESGFAM